MSTLFHRRVRHRIGEQIVSAITEYEELGSRLLSAIQSLPPTHGLVQSLADDSRYQALLVGDPSDPEWNGPEDYQFRFDLFANFVWGLARIEFHEPEIATLAKDVIDVSEKLQRVLEYPGSIPASISNEIKSIPDELLLKELRVQEDSLKQAGLTIDVAKFLIIKKCGNHYLERIREQSNREMAVVWEHAFQGITIPGPDLSRVAEQLKEYSPSQILNDTIAVRVLIRELLDEKLS